MKPLNPPVYELIVGNIGSVYKGSVQMKALDLYKFYVARSKDNIGVAGNEPVCLMRQGEPWKEFLPSVQSTKVS